MSSQVDMSVASDAASAVRAARRLVVKVGSAILCGDDGGPRSDWLASLAEDIANQRTNGVETVVVTSGAIALGRRRLGLKGALRLEEKQAASAAGQATLAQAWQKAFEPYDINIAQILLTLDDTEGRRRYLNARATLRTLLNLRAIPLINENDTIATSEIRYGDNDRLAAHGAQIVEADLLVILSDVDGLYTADPRHDVAAEHIPVVDTISSEIEAAAKGPNTAAGMGSGGMASKISAAKIACGAGCATVIAPGMVKNPIAAILAGGRATLFRPADTKERARRQWIAGRLTASGSVTIDSGAVRALYQGASLLPAGVTAVNGEFAKGDAVEIIASDGEVLGRGLSTYDASDISKIAGCKSEQIEEILGYRRRPAFIEKDDLVLRVT